MQPNWQIVFSTKNVLEATMIENLLKVEGIDVVRLNKQDSAYLVFGEVELFVLANQVVTAKRIIKNAVYEK